MPVCCGRTDEIATSVIRELAAGNIGPFDED